jgi:hypothetical protein
MARSVPVVQSAGAVATRVTGAGASVRTTAGVIEGRATAGVTRAADGEIDAAYGIAARAVSGVTGADCAWASADGRSIHAVVRPVLSAVTPVRATAIVASFQCFLSMALSSVQPIRRHVAEVYSAHEPEILTIPANGGRARRDVDDPDRIHAGEWTATMLKPYPYLPLREDIDDRAAR